MLGKANRDRTAERRESTRREIVDAAWDLARVKGLTEFTLADVAARVGMRAPSLYSHFDSKLAIYDAMFRQAWEEFLAVAESETPRLSQDPRARLRRIATTFFDFSVADPVRYQLMNQRVIPGFEPSDEAYAPSLRTVELLRENLAVVGIRKDTDVDLCMALIGGLVQSQLANDPGGTRYRRLLRRTVDLLADDAGL